MKMKKFIVSNLMIFSLVFAGCSSDDSNTPVTNQDPCEAAVTASASAKVNYETATNENFVTACIAYKAALMYEKQQCGDLSGAIQAKIDALGECSEPSQVEGTITVTAGTQPLTFDDVTVVKEGGKVKVMAETSATTNDYYISFEVQENTTGLEMMQNFEIGLISVMNPYMDDFHNNILTNTDGTISGTFYGYVVNGDNGVISLTNGNFNLTY
jgi:hypothetical protein